MIKINLLPVRAARRKETAKNELILGGAVLVFTMVIFLVWANSLNTQITRIEESIRDTERQLKDLEKVLKEIEVFKKKQANLRKKINIIKRLEEQRVGPVRVMDDLSNAIPPDVFIKTFNTKGSTISMKGFAKTNDDLIRFEENIRSKKTRYIANPVIKVTKNARFNKMNVKSFQMTIKANFSGKEPTKKKGRKGKRGRG